MIELMSKYEAIEGLNKDEAPVLVDLFAKESRWSATSKLFELAPSQQKSTILAACFKALLGIADNHGVGPFLEKAQGMSVKAGHKGRCLGELLDVFNAKQGDDKNWTLSKMAFAKNTDLASFSGTSLPWVVELGKAAFPFMPNLTLAIMSAIGEPEKYSWSLPHLATFLKDEAQSDIDDILLTRALKYDIPIMSLSVEKLREHCKPDFVALEAPKIINCLQAVNRSVPTVERNELGRGLLKSLFIKETTFTLDQWNMFVALGLPHTVDAKTLADASTQETLGEISSYELSPSIQYFDKRLMEQMVKNVMDNTGQLSPMELALLMYTATQMFLPKNFPTKGPGRTKAAADLLVQKYFSSDELGAHHLVYSDAINSLLRALYDDALLVVSNSAGPDVSGIFSGGLNLPMEGVELGAVIEAIQSRMSKYIQRLFNFEILRNANTPVKYRLEILNKLSIVDSEAPLPVDFAWMLRGSNLASIPFSDILELRIDFLTWLERMRSVHCDSSLAKNSCEFWTLFATNSIAGYMTFAEQNLAQKYSGLSDYSLQTLTAKSISVEHRDRIDCPEPDQKGHLICHIIHKCVELNIGEELLKVFSDSAPNQASVNLLPLAIRLSAKLSIALERISNAEKQINTAAKSKNEEEKKRVPALNKELESLLKSQELMFPLKVWSHVCANIGNYIWDAGQILESMPMFIMEKKVLLKIPSDEELGWTKIAKWLEKKDGPSAIEMLKKRDLLWKQLSETTFSNNATGLLMAFLILEPAMGKNIKWNAYGAVADKVKGIRTSEALLTLMSEAFYRLKYRNYFDDRIMGLYSVAAWRILSDAKANLLPENTIASLDATEGKRLAAKHYAIVTICIKNAANGAEADYSSLLAEYPHVVTFPKIPALFWEKAMDLVPDKLHGILMKYSTAIACTESLAKAVEIAKPTPAPLPRAIIKRFQFISMLPNDKHIAPAKTRLLQYLAQSKLILKRDPLGAAKRIIDDHFGPPSTSALLDISAANTWHPSTRWTLYAGLALVFQSDVAIPAEIYLHLLSNALPSRDELVDYGVKYRKALEKFLIDARSFERNWILLHQSDQVDKVQKQTAMVTSFVDGWREQLCDGVDLSEYDPSLKAAKQSFCHALEEIKQNPSMKPQASILIDRLRPISHRALLPSFGFEFDQLLLEKYPIVLENYHQSGSASLLQKMTLYSQQLNGKIMQSMLTGVHGVLAIKLSRFLNWDAAEAILNKLNEHRTDHLTDVDAIVGVLREVFITAPILAGTGKPSSAIIAKKDEL